MGKQLTQEEEQFIKDNWLIMENKDLAKKVGTSVNYITVKARRMGLPDKRNFRQEGVGTSIVAAEISNYGPCTETVLEIRARKKTLELLRIKEAINEEDILKVKVKGEAGKSHTRLINGVVIQKNRSFVTLRLENYTECFKYTDFYTGRAVIV